MTVQGFSTNIRREDVQRFMVGILLLAMVAVLLAYPDIANAAWDGKFGPSDDLKKNTNDSLEGWFQAFAGWGCGSQSELWPFRSSSSAASFGGFRSASASSASSVPPSSPPLVNGPALT